MTELHELMRQNVADPPDDDLDLLGVVAAGRRRARGRRVLVAGIAGSAVVSVAVVAALLVPRASDSAGPVHQPSPDAPTLHLSDATEGVEGQDFRVLASHTNQNLDQDNGQYFDGVTDDGLILFRDGPRLGRLSPRYALMDPSTGAKDWLPDPHLGQQDTVPVELSAHRLVLIGMGTDAFSAPMVAHVYDRDNREWHTVRWPELPDVEGFTGAMGPDGRLYVLAPTTPGHSPRGGWPTKRGVEADDSGAEGDTYHLWSVSLTDPSDARDENLTVGSIAFTPTTMVWTDSTNGAGGQVHVRTLATGEEHSFDPHAGDRCNLLSLSATEDRVVLDEYCGEYGHVRDDRVQILTTEGDQVATIQDDDISGWSPSARGDNDVVAIDAYGGGKGGAVGTYVYDLESDRFFRVSHGMSKFAMGGPVPAGELMWTTPVNHRHGATQWLGQVLR